MLLDLVAAGPVFYFSVPGSRKKCPPASQTDEQLDVGRFSDRRVTWPVVTFLFCIFIALFLPPTVPPQPDRTHLSHAHYFAVPVPAQHPSKFPNPLRAQSAPPPPRPRVALGAAPGDLSRTSPAHLHHGPRVPSVGRSDKDQVVPASVIAMAMGPTANNNTTLTLDPDPKPSARRRQVIVTEKKSTVEVVADGAHPAIIGDRIVINGKDLSHTLKGETVLERSRELSHGRKGLTVASTVSPRRRKSTSKPEKPRWLTVISILIKNSILLVVLFGLGRMIWKWSDQLSESKHMPFAALDFEGRISEVESSLKKTAKMMQIQLEVVDRKIGSETGSVRSEMTKKIEEKSEYFAKELKKLEAQSDSLEKSLAELRDTGLFSNEDLEKLLSDFRKGQNSENNDKHFTLDEIRTYAREVVEKEIEKHAADGLGRVDYALVSGGGRVVRHSEPYNLAKGTWFHVGKGRNGVHANANKMLQPSFGEPGQCFPLNGNTGFVEIKLRAGIIPDSVTLEHVAKSVAYDRSSAPKKCRISGWFEGAEDDASTRPERMTTLAEFTYDLGKSNAQTFPVHSSGLAVNMVRLDFTSNHGGPTHTCIYRLRVHGYEPSNPAQTAR